MVQAVQPTEQPDAAWTAETIYRRLVAGATPEADPFDIHVLACILTIGADESREASRPLTEAVGLQPDELAALLERYFPDAEMPAARPPDTIERAPDEICVLDLLCQAATSGALAEQWLAPMIARRAQRPDHLWRNLGLRARTELSALMRRHFRVLAARNTQDMKWKKYLYRTICGDTGFSLCTAPSCSECVDFDACFGDESGESFLARARRRADTAT